MRKVRRRWVNVMVTEGNGTGNLMLGYGMIMNIHLFNYSSEFDCSPTKHFRWPITCRSEWMHAWHSECRTLASRFLVLWAAGIIKIYSGMTCCCFRLLNKFLFFTFGTKDVFERVCKGLNERIDLYLDDVHINLPDIEGLIFLNIPYWGAGVKVNDWI